MAGQESKSAVSRLKTAYREKAKARSLTLEKLYGFICAEWNDCSQNRIVLSSLQCGCVFTALQNCYTSVTLRCNIQIWLHLEMRTKLSRTSPSLAPNMTRQRYAPSDYQVLLDKEGDVQVVTKVQSLPILCCAVLLQFCCSEKVWQSMTKYDKVWRSMTKYDKIVCPTTSILRISKCLSGSYASWGWSTFLRS